MFFLRKKNSFEMVLYPKKLLNFCVDVKFKRSIWIYIQTLNYIQNNWYRVWVVLVVYLEYANVRINPVPCSYFPETEVLSIIGRIISKFFGYKNYFY